jgi:hypothetical protein
MVLVFCSDLFGFFGFLSVLALAFFWRIHCGHSWGILFIIILVILGFFWIHFLASRIGDMQN